MKFQFKHKEYQAASVNAVVDCFAGLTEGGFRHDLARLDAEIHLLPTG